MERKKLFNNRGDITDMMVLLIVLFILAVGMIIIVYTITSIVGGLNVSGLNETTETAQAIEGLDNFGQIMIQRGFLLLFTGLIISVLITSFFANTHPIWLFLYIIMLGITILAGVYLGSAYQEIQTLNILSDVIDSQPMINFVMNNILTIISAVGILSLIIVFAKFKSKGGDMQI